MSALRNIIVGGLLLALTMTCKKDEVFESLGDKFATPTDVAAHSSGDYFFILNSDDTRDYDAGSILVVTKDGEKAAVFSTPRLGRSLSVAGNDMLVSYAYSGDDSEPRVELYDVTDAKAIKLSRSWSLGTDCNPINALLRANYKYFAVTCANGAIYIGELKSPRSDSELHLVRRYPGARRAVYLDPNRNLLLAFTTEVRARTISDAMYDDVKSYADGDTTRESQGANEIPDTWESTRTDRRNKLRRGIFQHVVYDIAAEAAKGFPKLDDYTLPEVQKELRWTYFSLSNFDGSPDVPAASLQEKRYYRTNFWAAEPDPTNVDVFYLSHRGTSETNYPGSSHANSIIRVTIKGDLRASGEVVPKTDEVFSFERVYGFKGELEPTGKHYPGAFKIQQVQGRNLLVVNHFRDIKNFPVSHYSSIAAKILGDNSWFTELSNSVSGNSYYQLAMTATGRAMAISFYQNNAILLDVLPDADITEVKKIAN